MRSLIGPIVILLVVLLPCSVSSYGGFYEEGKRGRNRWICPYEKPQECEEYHEPQCMDDVQCPGILKCCLAGCVMKCRQPVDRKKLKCFKALDLGILFDTQENSTMGKSVKVLKKMIRRTVKRVPIDADKTHVALAVIAEKPEILLRFDDLEDLQVNRGNVVKRLRRVKAQSSQGNIVQALRMVGEIFTAAQGSRADANKVLVVFSDGITDDYSQLEEVMQPIKDHGVIVKVVGIGKEHELEEFNLLTIATARSCYFRRFTSDLFDDLRSMIKRHCE